MSATSIGTRIMTSHAPEVNFLAATTSTMTPVVTAPSAVDGQSASPARLAAVPPAPHHSAL